MLSINGIAEFADGVDVINLGGTVSSKNEQAVIPTKINRRGGTEKHKDFKLFFFIVIFFCRFNLLICE